MKLSRLYQLAIKYGSLRDPRNRNRSFNYADSAILYGRADTEVKKIIVGIDVEVGELLLAEEIRKKQGLDLVMSHHPEGFAYASLYQVMQLQVDVLKKAGVNEAIAQKLLDERKLEVERRLLPQNHTRPVDAARLLDLPFMCVHTPADNHVYAFINNLMAKRKPKTVKDIVSVLLDVPEYQLAEKSFTGPKIIAGSPHRMSGKILVDMTGGTEGSKDVFDKLYKAGVRTLIAMHLGEEHFKKVKDANLNVVIAGHISSDTLGLNLLLDNIEREEAFQITSFSGFNRIKRN
ncbi:MAG: NGG1p interacting factor NIF3 [Candidatus Omnitrophica bacterium]|nr:NGG1p interacting factor NIF3 [Candidatus Omnitrophota bacterium]